MKAYHHLVILYNLEMRGLTESPLIKRACNHSTYDWYGMTGDFQHWMTIPAMHGGASCLP